jgi:lysophospholipase L1-like esterase
MKGANMSTTGKAESYIELKGSLSLPDAITGKSAYEIAVMHGFDGTEEEWLLHLERAQAEEVEEAAEQAKTDISEAKKTMLSEIELAAEIVQTTGDSETAVMSQKAVTDNFNSIREIVESVNLFDKNNAENRDGFIIQTNKTSYTAIAGFTVTHPIKADKGEYTFHTKAVQLGGNAVLVAPCNASGEILAKPYTASDNGNNTATFTVGDTWGGTHFVVNIYNKDIDSFMVVRGGTMPTAYSPYEAPKAKLKAEAMPDDLISEEMLADLLKTSSPLYGKKLSLNGDSICYGTGSTGGYGAILAERNNITLQNIARSGGTIAAETYASDGTTARHWICRTIANMDADADYAIVEGGVNDASVKPPLGTITSGLNATLDDTTFYGAFESMCKQLTMRFAGKKIGYIMVHQMHGDFSPVNADNYYWAAKKCCEKWGVPFLDLSVSCPPFGLIFPSNTEMYPLRETYTANADGWHPNEEGYKKYYVPKIEAWLKTL